MRSTQETPPRILIEEHYTCDVDVGFQVNTVCKSDKGIIHISIPYDGRYFKDLTADALPHELGHLVLTHAADSQMSHAIPVTLDTQDLETRIKSGLQYTISTTYPLPEPTDTLLAVEGTVFDGADLRPHDDVQEQYNLLFGQTDVFVNDLRLRLSLWVPDLIGQSTFDSEAEELNRMIQEHENDTQVFLSDISNVPAVAMHMAALANTNGGRILFGVRPNGAIIGLPSSITEEQIDLHILKAALLCSPAISLLAPRIFVLPQSIDEPPRMLVSVGVVPIAWQTHTIKNAVYRRHNAATVRVRHIRTAATVAAPAGRYIGSLRDIIASGSSRDVIVIDAHNTPVDQLELGYYICALINAHVTHGLLLIRNLAPEQPSSLLERFFRRSSGVVRQLEMRIAVEQQRITPTLPRIIPEFTTVDGERVALVRVSSALTPAALYDNHGFVWDGGVLREIPLADVLARYLHSIDAAEAQRSAQTQVVLDEGQLLWPVQPPTQLKINHLAAQDRISTAAYDVQRRAMVWRAQLFSQQEGTNGFTCELTTRLRQAFDDPQRSNDDLLSPLEGLLHIRFDHALASRADVLFRPASDLPPHVSGWLRQAAIQKRTHIIVRLKIAANELFQNRRHMVLLHTRTPDIALGQERSERIVDLQQAFADSGFWIYDIAPDSRDINAPPFVIMRGIRSAEYCDIHLLAGMQYEPAQLTRELRYQERTDSKTVQSGLLDSRFVLWGTGDKAADQLAHFQIELGDLIQERLQYLRSE